LNWFAERDLEKMPEGAIFYVERGIQVRREDVALV
jgi:hypothetical protein